MSRKTTMLVVRYSLLLAGLFSFSCVWAQNRHIDSLSTVLAHTEDEQLRADLQHDLAQQLFNHDYEKGVAYARESLRLSRTSAYPRGEAQALTAIGNYYFYKGEYPTALSHYNQAVQAIRSQVAADYPAKTYLRMSILYRQQAYFDSAQRYLEKSRALLPKGKEGALHAAYYASSGILAHKMSRNEQALGLLKQALAIRKTVPDPSRLADTWRVLSEVYTSLALYDSAEFSLAQAQELIGPDTDPEVQMLIHLSRGETYFARGDYPPAIVEYNKALDRLRINPYQRHYAHLLFKIGELYEKQGGYHAAFEYFFAALKEFEKINARQDLARVYTQIGWSYNYQENYPLALENAAKSLQFAREIGDSASIAQNKNLIGYAALKQGRLSEAWQSLQEALTIRLRIKNWWGATYTLYNMGQVQLQLGNPQKALELYNQALQTSQRIGHKSAFVFINNKLGEWYTQNRQYEQAAHYLSQAGAMAKRIALPTQLLVTYRNYISLYDQQQMPDSTIYYFKAYTALSDSLTAELSTGRMARADALFQLQEKAAELQLVTTEKELQNTKDLSPADRDPLSAQHYWAGRR
ncbi:tetratricopeptide repeat protein [Cesiribacter andamanensis]|uniref:tetratricopeptide repeat protein n=1 Tax=Cesiribacter andamanensis TaxID=649507 RepID=UPI001378AD7A|nr:tetratricopeptide repeat protein [Cesiribacter andamanensis]